MSRHQGYVINTCVLPAMTGQNDTSTGLHPFVCVCVCTLMTTPIIGSVRIRPGWGVGQRSMSLQAVNQTHKRHDLNQDPLCTDQSLQHARRHRE